MVCAAKLNQVWKIQYDSSSFGFLRQSSSGMETDFLRPLGNKLKYRVMEINSDADPVFWARFEPKETPSEQLRNKSAYDRTDRVFWWSECNKTANSVVKAHRKLRVATPNWP